jgi:hypothetical protein
VAGGREGLGGRDGDPLLRERRGDAVRAGALWQGQPREVGPRMATGLQDA